MNLKELKQTNLNSLLPKGLKDSLVCYTLTNSEVVPESPDVVTCHKNGCFYEIRHKKIIRSLNLNETASSVRCYHLSENDKIVLFYLVLTTGFRLLVIRRGSKHLKIVKDYDGVKDFQVYDFQCLGFPQIQMRLLNDGRSLICKFPVESIDEADSFENSSAMADSLADELQDVFFTEQVFQELQYKFESKIAFHNFGFLRILNMHVDNLTEEYNQLEKMCFFSNTPPCFENIFVDLVTFSLPLNEGVQHKLVVSSKWLKVFGNRLILGMKVCNVGCKVIQDMEVTINHKKIKDYAYSFFQSSNDFGDYLFSPRANTRFVKPGEQISAVVTFQIPEFFSESEFLVPFCVTCSESDQSLLKDSIEVKIQDVASRTTLGLEEHFTVEDLLALKVIGSEIRVKIQTDDLKECTMECILTENLLFKRVKHLKDKLFYCTSTYLREVFVALKHITVNPSVWKLVILSSDLSQLYFLVNVLYDLLPENTAILYDED